MGKLDPSVSVLRYLYVYLLYLLATANHKAGKPKFNALYNADKDHPVEVTGRKLRKMMKWIHAKEV